MTKLNVFRIENESIMDPSIIRYINNLGSDSQEISLQDSSHSRLFIFKSNPKVPDWVDYLKELSESGILDVQPLRTAGAILIIQPNLDVSIVYVFAWGNGHHRVNKNRIVHSLGIRCVLNMMSTSKSPIPVWDPARIKSIKTKRLGLNPLIIESQYARDSSLEEFPVDTDSDQLKSITGRPIDATTWGKLISGGVSLHIDSPNNPHELIKVCEEISEIFSKTSYRDYFEWVDHVSPFTDVPIINELDNLIIEKLKIGDGGDLLMTIPDLMNWESVDYFEYQIAHNVSNSIVEPDFIEFRAFLSSQCDLGNLTVDFLKNSTFVKAFDGNNNEIQSWSGYDCISGELEYKSNHYLLDDGEYFKIEKDFLQNLNTYVDNIPEFTGKLPKRTTEKTEDDYIETTAKSAKEILKMHKKLVHRTGSSPIEVCDILFPTGHLLHLKVGTHSSLLSHLFSQASVCGELLLFDDEFKSKIKVNVEKAAKEKKITDLTPYEFLYSNFKSSSCTIVLGFITGKAKGKLSKILPFFSKINLKSFCKSYQRMGYKYEIAQIHN